MNTPRTIRAVLFDLDGTLLDTAPDMAAALNTLRVENGLPALPYDRLRPNVSHGAIGLVKAGFGIDLEPEHRDELIQRFLQLYADALAVNTVAFDGVTDTIDRIETRGLRWGIVTNKPGWLTEPLLTALQFGKNAGCVISGDALAERKPHPAPLHHAAGLLETDPADCIYVGDAERDIQAGRAAGMLTLVAAYGYIRHDDAPENWQADGTLEHVSQLVDWLGDDVVA